jgi:UDP-N-acetylmuramoyl-L-alanyl-D-glutamate--2,6-diaminopimelate ligase
MGHEGQRMKLARLLSHLDAQFHGSGPGNDTPGNDLEIGALFCRAQDVQPGGLFVAVKGFTADGHEFIDQALDNGAVAVVCERPVTADALMIRVANSRKALAELAATFYGDPSEDLTVIAVTGTNGKTTTSYLIESILQAAGKTVGVIGTINYRYDGKIFDNPVTTPESLDLQRILAAMRDAGVTHVVMEVSSHGLDLYRVHGCRIDIGVFTNFSQDHLDYHKDMAHYWACKRRLFSDLLPAHASKTRLRAVINVADPKGRILAREITLPCLTCGHQGNNDLRTLKARFDLQGMAARIATPQGKLEFHSPLVGRHNLENILNAVGVGVALQIPLESMAAGIGSLDHVPGRLERIPNAHRRFVYVDYAHTPDALENALLALRALTADRIICVFGCGGDRDKAKRPEMGAIAAQLSDLTVVTSDNPRTEPPERIIEEIVAGIGRKCDRRYPPGDLQNGFRGKGYAVIADRHEAIRGGIVASRPGDTLLIAGKGHEPYQIIGHEKRPFDDRQEALQAMAELL